MKSSQRLYILVGMLAITGGVVVLTTVLGGKFLRREAANGAPAACQKTGRTYKVVIKDNAAEPAQVDAHRCDQMTIQNLDERTRLIGFGDHSKHVAYNCVTERVLAQGETMRLVLNKTGAYHFHDHYQDSLEVNFTVR